MIPVELIREKAARLVAMQRAYLASYAHRTFRGFPLDFQRFRYLAMPYADDGQDIVLQTGVQTGKTEWLLADAMAIISLGGDYQLVEPKADLNYVFLTTRLKPSVDCVPFYREHVTSHGAIIKWLNGGMLRVTFSTREDEMKSYPADAVGVDELDACNKANLALLPDRMKQSYYRLERRCSTPTTVGTDSNQNINWFYSESNQGIYLVPCDCGEEQEIDWHNNVVLEKRNVDTGELISVELRDTDWNETLKRDIHVLCRSCGRPIDRLREGRWHFRAPHAQRHGYHLNKTTSPLITIRELWKSYSDARFNPVKLQAFFNSDLGLPYVGVGNNVTREMLHACRGDLAFDESTSTAEGPCSMGVDVGPRWLDVHISDYPSNGKRRARYIGKVEKFEELHDLVARFHVEWCVIDAEPEVRKSLEFQADAKCEVIVCYTKSLASMSMDDLDGKRVRADKTFTMDRTLGMDCVWSSYARREVELPKNYAFLSDGRFIEEMTTPTRVLTIDENTMREMYVWTHGNDHSFLADTYDYMAMKIGGLRYVEGPLYAGSKERRMFLVGPSQRFAGGTLNDDMG